MGVYVRTFGIVYRYGCVRMYLILCADVGVYVFTSATVCRCGCVRTSGTYTVCRCGCVCTPCLLDAPYSDCKVLTN